MPKIWVAEINDRLSMMKISKSKVNRAYWDCHKVDIDEDLFNALENSKAHLLHDESGDYPARNAVRIPNSSSYLVPNLLEYNGFDDNKYRYIEVSNVGFGEFETGGRDEDLDYEDKNRNDVDTLSKRKEWFHKLYEKLVKLDSRYTIVDYGDKAHSFIYFYIDGITNKELVGKIGYYNMSNAAFLPDVNGVAIKEYCLDDEFVHLIHDKIATKYQYEI